ncbi:MAG: hypothetical protein QF357_05615 [Dehalococcoidia bacterium]|jgi:hypothetical protein|nr:hypothetical protein [Dehalococcoidia bacterium]
MEFTVINADVARQAGQVFTDKYQLRKASEDTLNADLANPDLNNTEQVSRLVVEWAGDGASVAAHQDGVLRGFMVGRFIEFLHACRAFYVPEWGLGVNADNPQRLIGQMYAWLTRSGQLDGSTLHALTVFSADRDITDFQTANVEGAGFWLGSGFRPVLTTLARRISG